MNRPSPRIIVVETGSDRELKRTLASLGETEHRVLNPALADTDLPVQIGALIEPGEGAIVICAGESIVALPADLGSTVPARSVTDPGLLPHPFCPSDRRTMQAEDLTWSKWLACPRGSSDDEGLVLEGEPAP